MKLTPIICLGTFLATWSLTSTMVDLRASRAAATNESNSRDQETSPGSAGTRSQPGVPGNALVLPDVKNLKATGTIVLPPLSDLDQAILQDPENLRGDAAALKVALTRAIGRALTGARASCLGGRPADPSILHVNLNVVVSSKDRAHIDRVPELRVAEGAPLGEAEMACLSRLVRKLVGQPLSPPERRKFAPMEGSSATVKVNICGPLENVASHASSG
jgi:hypothetical protein